MPSYDFRCHDCDALFEKRLSMSAYERGEERECPGCGSARVERAYTTVNVIAGSKSAGGGGGASGGACCRPGFT